MKRGSMGNECVNMSKMNEKSPPFKKIINK